MSLRAVPLDEEQYDFLEQLGFEFIRAGHHDRASKLLAICLAWKMAPEARGGSDGAAPLVDASSSASPGTGAASDGKRPSAPTVFRCDPDESAGLAEVVELHGYSKGVPCS